MKIKKNNILKNVSLFLESKYFLALISLITVLNFSINAGLWTYIEAGIILILMMILKSNFVYVPSIFIFIIGGGLTSLPNYKRGDESAYPDGNKSVENLVFEEKSIRE